MTKRHPTRPVAAAAAAALLALAGAAQAQTSTPASGAAAPSTATVMPIPAGERRFAENAAQSSMAEIQLAQTAQSKASSIQVKQYAERMLKDHRAASDELQQIAHTKGLQMPAELDRRHKGKAEDLAKLSGTEFDREYMKQMVDDHEKAVSDFEKQAKDGRDTELKAFASKHLPTLQEHLRMARQINDSVKSAKAGG